MPRFMILLLVCIGGALLIPLIAQPAMMALVTLEMGPSDIYYVTLRHTFWGFWMPNGVIGCCVGAVACLYDLWRNGPRAERGWNFARFLIANLGWGFVYAAIVCATNALALHIYSNYAYPMPVHRRYHSFPPRMELLYFFSLTAFYMLRIFLLAALYLTLARQSNLSPTKLWGRIQQMRSLG